MKFVRRKQTTYGPRIRRNPCFWMRLWRAVETTFFKSSYDAFVQASCGFSRPFLKFQFMKSEAREWPSAPGSEPAVASNLLDIVGGFCDCNLLDLLQWAEQPWVLFDAAGSVVGQTQTGVKSQSSAGAGWLIGGSGILVPNRAQRRNLRCPRGPKKH